MEAKIDQIQQLRKIVDVILRRKILILGFVLLATVAGLAAYLVQHKVYQSSCLLSFQQQKVSPARMSPDVRGRIRDVISTISQIVLSRTSLEEIIKTQRLYEEQRQKMPMQDVVEAMREKIDISPSRRGDTFSITFIGKEPDLVARVTNALAARFVEENLKYRQERATEISSYTQNELDMAKEMLDKKEVILRDYKLRFYNEMPEQRQTNMDRLNALQQQYQGKQESIQDLERTRVLIQDQIAARRELLENYISGRTVVSSPEEPTDALTNRQKLERLQAVLISLQDRYTDKHPKMRSLKKKINRLKKIVLEDSPKTLPSDGDVNQGGGEIADQALFDLQLQLKEIKLQIANIKKEMEIIPGQIKKYEAWVAAAPVREAEWSAISREYGELKRHYDFLVAQNLQAKSAMNLERKQQGSQFKIEDSARVPVTPIRPVFIKIMGMAIVLGAAVGGGFAFGLELIDSSFRDPLSLENAYGVEVICSVPNLSLKNEIIKDRIWTTFGTVTVVTCSLCILVAMIYFYKKGHIILSL